MSLEDRDWYRAELRRKLNLRSEPWPVEHTVAPGGDLLRGIPRKRRIWKATIGYTLFFTVLVLAGIFTKATLLGVA